MVHLSKCWRCTCSCVGMLKGHMGNKMLGTLALKTRSIKICRSLLQVPHNDCACSYFRPKAFNDMALCIASLAGGNTIAISTGETNKNVTVKFLKKHMTSSTLHFFSSLCSTAAPKTYNFLKTKHTTHRAYVVTVRTRAVKILHTRAKHVK